MALDTTAKSATGDSYATLAEYRAYLTAIGLSANGDDDTDEANLRRAVHVLDRSYSWHGNPSTQEQKLDWPRSMAQYVDGYPVDVDEVPQDIKDAQCEMAYLIQEGATPFATLEQGAVKSKREKVDVIEEWLEYSTTRDRPAYPAVDQLVAPYAKGKAGSVNSVGLMRA